MYPSIRQLRAFATIGRLRSFTKASDVLHTTQPALSAQISQLEDGLGVRLFDRSTRSVTLTQVGNDLLPVVDKVIRDLDSLVTLAKGIAHTNIGRIAVAALPSICSAFLPEAVAEFRKAFPGVNVVLTDALGERIVELINSDEVDFGISSSALNNRQMEFVPLGGDELVAVMPKKHPLARAKKRLKLEDLLDLPLIFMSRDTSVRRIVDDACAASGRLPVPAYEAAYMSTAIGMVRAGLGLTLLPSSALELAVASDLVGRTLADPRLERSIGIVRKRGRSLSPASQRFVETLQKKANVWFTRSVR